MIYAAVLAGGSGTRMNISNMPKQFLELKDQAIIVHTLEKFLTVPDIDRIYVGVHPDWLDYLQTILEKSMGELAQEIIAVPGGTDRNSTILNVIEEMKKRDNIGEEDILITHDAVRPFLSRRIILDNIEAAKRYDAVDTVVPAVDTIVASEDGKTISNIPDRSKLYQGQTPQTFRPLEFVRLFEALTDEQKAVMTDACKIFSVSGKSVGLVDGEYANLKITTITDLKIARAMVEETDD